MILRIDLESTLGFFTKNIPFLKEKPLFRAATRKRRIVLALPFEIRGVTHNWEVMNSIRIDVLESSRYRRTSK